MFSQASGIHASNYVCLGTLKICVIMNDTTYRDTTYFGGSEVSVLCVPRLFDWCYERGATDCEVDITYRGSHSKTLLLETDKSELCCAVQIRVISENIQREVSLHGNLSFNSIFIRIHQKSWNC
jgi:hypothetical protein